MVLSSLPRNDDDNGDDDPAVTCTTTPPPNTWMLSRQRLFTSMPSRVAAIVAVGAVSSSTADARNLAVSNGADTSQVGTATAFVPILQLPQDLESLKGILDDEEQRMKQKSNSDDRTNNGRKELQFSRIANTKSVSCFPAKSTGNGVAVTAAITAIPEIPFQERDFKRIFDAYSDPVNYKQNFSIRILFWCIIPKAPELRSSMNGKPYNSVHGMRLVVPENWGCPHQRDAEELCRYDPIFVQDDPSRRSVYPSLLLVDEK